MKKYIFIIIPLLMILLPIMSEQQFKRNAVEIDADITYIEFDSYNEHYHIGVKFEVDGEEYSGELSYNYSNLPKGNTEKILYNSKKPKEFTSIYNHSSSAKEVIGGISAILGACFLVIGIVCVYILNFNTKKNETFEEQQNKYEKQLKKILLISIILSIVTLIIILKEYRRPQKFDIIGILSIMVFIFSMVGIIGGLIDLYSIKRLKRDEIYPLLLANKIEKKIVDPIFQIYFTEKCLVDMTRIFKKIYYKNIKIIDIEENIGRKGGGIWIIIVDERLKKRIIASTNVLVEVDRHLEIIEEIKKRVPDVLVGYTKENIEKVKLMKDNNLI